VVAELVSFHCCGFRNITEHRDQAVVVCGASLESLDRGVSRPGYWSESRKSRIDAQPALECRQGDAETSDQKAGLKLAGLISRHLCLYLLNMCGAREVYSAGMRSILHRAHDYAAEHVPRLQFPQQRLPPATMCAPSSGTQCHGRSARSLQQSTWRSWPFRSSRCTSSGCSSGRSLLRNRIAPFNALVICELAALTQLQVNQFGACLPCWAPES
jgi:hypothetical protein